MLGTSVDIFLSLSSRGFASTLFLLSTYSLYTILADCLFGGVRLLRVMKLNPISVMRFYI